MLNSRVSIIGAVAASVMMASSAAQAGSHSVPKLPCETCLLYTSPSPRDVEESGFAGWGC